MLKRCVQILILNVILVGLTVVSAQETATLRLLVGPDALVLYVAAGPIWLGDLEFRWVNTSGEIQHVRLLAGFDVLSLTAGYAKTGSCFIYQLDKSTSPLPSVCRESTLIFRRNVVQADVFWYDALFNQTRTVTVIGAGTDSLGAYCPAGNFDCPLGWQVTPSPMPATTDSLQAALELARTPVLHNADWTPVTHTFDGVEMVLVPAGCFEMGNDPEAYYYDHPDFIMSVPGGGQQCFDQPFWLGKYEVTNAQYKRCVDAGVCTLPGDRTYYDDAAYSDHPVVFVDWSRAQTYADWSGGSLPTEREWEYAARGPDAPFFPWGNEFDKTHLNYCDKNCESDGHDTIIDDGYRETAPVGSYPAGVSWTGAMDLSGNVWEWTSSVGQSYPYQADDGREDLDKIDVFRVLRGGSWFSYGKSARCASRYFFKPDSAYNEWGFRILLATSVL